jgi:hypothetical protein
MVIDCLLFAVACRLHNLLKKRWTKRIAIPRCPRHPMMLSTSFAVVLDDHVDEVCPCDELVLW